MNQCIALFLRMVAEAAWEVEMYKLGAPMAFRALRHAAEEYAPLSDYIDAR